MTNPIDKRIPLGLKPGDCIGIVAPASPFEEADFYAGIGILENMGFRVSFPEGIFARSGYLAGSDADRAAQVNAAFARQRCSGHCLRKGRLRVPADSAVSGL